MVALMRQRRRVGAVIIARDQQHAAVLGGAGEVHVLEHVAAAVHARALAVPQGEHAVVVRLPDQVHLLRAPYRGGGQLLVDTGLELDVMRVEMLARLPERLVQAAQRRAAVTGDEASRVQPGRDVPPALHQREAHQGLNAGQVDAAAVDSTCRPK